MKIRFVAVALAMLLALGCAATQKALAPPSVEYVKADIQFEALLGDQIVLWIQRDPELTMTEKQALIVALANWRAMVAEAEKTLPKELPE